MVQLCRMPQACNRPTTHLRTINMCKIFSPGTWQNHIQFHSLLKYSLHRLLKRTSLPHKGINFFISSSEKGINQPTTTALSAIFPKENFTFLSLHSGNLSQKMAFSLILATIVSVI